MTENEQKKAEDHGGISEPVETPNSTFLALRNKALKRLFPGTLTGINDAALETIPRLVGMEIEYRGRLIEELATMQHLLLTELLRPMKNRAKATAPALVREMRALIKDQLQMVKEAPLGTGADAAKTQARDLLTRRAFLLAEIRRKGLERLLERSEKPEEERSALPPSPSTSLDDIVAGAVSEAASMGQEEKGTEPDAGGDASGRVS